MKVEFLFYFSQFINYSTHTKTEKNTFYNEKNYNNYIKVKLQNPFL